MLLLKRSDVESLLDLSRLVDVVASAMADLSSGLASQPPRIAAMVAERHALLAAMPAYLPSTRSLATKLVSLFPDNRHRPTHQALICCFDAEDGRPLAVMDGTAITAARTAAGSALASRLLARPESQVVAVVGTGVEAKAHLGAMAVAWPTARLRVAGRNSEKVHALIEEASSGLESRVEVAPTIVDAIANADIICATTHAAEPVIRRTDLAAGTHVNSIGYNSSGSGEVDVPTLRDAIVAVESRAAALAPPPAGAVELRLAIDSGHLDAGRILEVGELVLGGVAGRTDADQITVYKSVGVAVQDAAAASLVLEAAAARGVGMHVSL